LDLHVSSLAGGRPAPRVMLLRPRPTTELDASIVAGHVARVKSVSFNAVIGLGSNLGNPEASILRAVDALERAPWVELCALSSGYWTAPVGVEDQPRFLNAAALVASELDPSELMAMLLGVEAGLGRVRRRRWGPRRIDLDLLWAERRTHSTPLLELPHPRLRERGFALAPLVELLPDARDPSTGVPYGELLQRLDQRLDPPLPLPSSLPYRRRERANELTLSVSGRTRASTIELILNSFLDVVFDRTSITERERQVIDLAFEAPEALVASFVEQVLSMLHLHERRRVWKRLTLLSLDRGAARLVLFGETLRENDQISRALAEEISPRVELCREARGHRWRASLAFDLRRSATPV
jgi:2-amino-4-hydroxy-6-hydroxymethyldihydropteridine diphosphokinase